MCKTLLLILTFCLAVQSSYSQVSFQKGTDLIFGNGITSTVATAIADMDGDTYDDIIFLSNGNKLSIMAYRGERVPYQLYFQETSTTASVWSIVVGDINNDARNDVILASTSGIFRFMQTENGTFTKTNIYTTQWLPQTSNLADIDGDGDLDYFLCNDDATNLTLLNDGNGNFSESGYVFKTPVDSLNSGNYGSIWTDIDNDGDQDLYIAKCKAGVTDPTDYRRINQLFINDGDGSFTESATEYGVADGAQSWSVDAGDVDNDGDIDLLVMNHTNHHKLYLNNQDTFEVFDSYTLSNYAFEGHFEDIDNNGWLDIILSDGNNNLVSYNNNMQFTHKTWDRAGENTTIVQLLDANHDGFADLWSPYTTSNITSGENYKRDDILLNQGNTNNYLAFSTNPQQILAVQKYVLTGDFGEKTRTPHLGSSYGHQRSSIARFGLGEYSTAQELIVTWADGTNTTYDLTDIGVNEHYILDVSGCISKRETPQASNNGYLCDSSLVEIFSEKSTPVIWNIADTNTSINIYENDNIRYHYIDENGCPQYSKYQNVLSDSVQYATVINTDTFQTICVNDMIQLKATEAKTYEWNTGNTEQTITVDEAGEYIVTVTSKCGNTFVSNHLIVEQFEVETPKIEGDTIRLGQTATLSANAFVNWYNDANTTEETFIGEGYVYETAPLDPSTTFYAVKESSKYTKQNKLGINKSIPNDQYSSDKLNGGIRFTISSPIIIKSFQVETDKEGSRRIRVTKDGELVSTRDVYIYAGTSRIDVDIELHEPGNYFIDTDKEENIQNFGHNGPHLTRNQTGVTYPYALGDDIVLYGSNYGAKRYFYFYDWEIAHGYITCTSEVVPVDVKIGTSSTIDIEEELKIYPNPVNGSTLYIDTKVNTYQYEIYDMLGQEIISNHTRTNQINLPLFLGNGTYYLRLITATDRNFSTIFVLNR